ncbi:MAG: hypothetical protein ACTHOK_18690 [Nocardioidaceae bacterium]
MRPLLRPGLHPLQRGDGQLQLGLDPREAVVLPDTETVRRELDRLDGTHAWPAPAGASGGDVAAPLLRDLGLLLDERALLPHLRDPAGAPAAAAVALRAGDGTSDALRSRRAARVGLCGFGHAAGAAFGDRLAELLDAAGVGLRTSARARLSVGVLAGVGEPDRELLDGWTRDGTPYLLVRLVEGRAVVGPFVVPGRTACLRCIDAYHADVDPAWPLLVRQYAAASSRDRADCVPEPVDPLLTTLALAWAARDVVAHVEGARPSTWSSTTVLEPTPGTLETRMWHRHPDCGCRWG